MQSVKPRAPLAVRAPLGRSRIRRHPTQRGPFSAILYTSLSKLEYSSISGSSSVPWAETASAKDVAVLSLFSRGCPLGAVPSAGAAAASAFTAAPPAISGKAPAEAALSGCSVGAFLSGGPYTKSLHGDTRACRQDQHLCTGKPPSLQSRRGSARHTRTHTRGRRVLRRTARGSSPEKWDGREHRHPHDDPAHERRPQHQQHGERPATLLSPRAAVTREQRSGRPVPAHAARRRWHSHPHAPRAAACPPRRRPAWPWNGRA